MVPVATIITGITFVFTFHMHCISIVRSLYFRVFSASFLITFLSPKIATSINIHVLFYYYYYYYYYYYIVFIRYQIFLPWLPSRNIRNFTYLSIARISRSSSTWQQLQISYALMQICLVRTFHLWKRHHENVAFHNTHWFNYLAILCLNLSHKPSLCLYRFVVLFVCVYLCNLWYNYFVLYLQLAFMLAVKLALV